MQLDHFLYECLWLLEELRKGIREARAAWAFARGTTPWNPPTTTASTDQAEEQQTAVRIEPATGADEAQQREPVSILKPNKDPQDAVPKTARVRAPRSMPMPCWQKGEDSPVSACRAGGFPHGRLGPFYHTPL